MNKTGRLKFVAGDSPRAFAQETLKNLSEEDWQQMASEEVTTRSGRMIFKSGDDGEEMISNEEGVEEQYSSEMQKKMNVTQQPRRVRPLPNQTPASVAADVYNQMLILGELYQDLISFNTNFTSSLQDMQAELDVIIFAMGRIYQTLSRSNRLPRQNLRKPQIRAFCSGVVTTSNFLRGLLYDLRLLVRINQNQSVDNQLIVILLTLQSQQSQLFEIRQDCIEEGALQ